MPIERPSDLRPIAQHEFGDIAFEVIRQAYIVRRELGIFFDESIYRNALRVNIGAEAQTEVRIGVRFENFRHEYFMDLLVSHAAVFELKSVENIVDVHRSQLLNYLLLCGLHHGKLINFGHGALQHEFVNALLTQQDRTT
ncbi:MAG: GxxExxY protein, partial [Pirellulaceae bacterium]|nr:GxxExxY protein [Pirellulaceae bacterium]